MPTFVPTYASISPRTPKLLPTTSPFIVDVPKYSNVNRNVDRSTDGNIDSNFNNNTNNINNTNKINHINHTDNITKNTNSNNNINTKISSINNINTNSINNINYSNNNSNNKNINGITNFNSIKNSFNNSSEDGLPLKKLFYHTSEKDRTPGIQLKGNAKPIKERIPMLLLDTPKIETKNELKNEFKSQKRKIYTRMFPLTDRKSDSTSTISVLVKAKKIISREHNSDLFKKGFLSPRILKSRELLKPKKKSAVSLGSKTYSNHKKKILQKTSKENNLSPKNKYSKDGSTNSLVPQRSVSPKNLSSPKNSSKNLSTNNFSPNNLSIKDNFSDSRKLSLKKSKSNIDEDIKLTKFFRDNSNIARRRFSAQGRIERKALSLNISYSQNDSLEISTPRLNSARSPSRRGSTDIPFTKETSSIQKHLTRKGVPILPQTPRKSIEIDVRPILFFDPSNWQISEVYPEHERKAPLSAHSSKSVNNIEKLEDIDLSQIPNLNFEMLNISTKQISLRNEISQLNIPSTRSERSSTTVSQNTSARSRMQFPTDIHYIPHTEILTHKGMGGYSELIINEEIDDLHELNGLHDFHDSHETQNVNDIYNDQETEIRKSPIQSSKRFFFFYKRLNQKYWPFVLQFLSGIDLCNLSYTNSFFSKIIFNIPFFEERRQLHMLKLRRFLDTVSVRSIDIPLNRMNLLQKKLKSLKFTELSDMVKLILDNAASHYQLNVLSQVCSVVFHHRLHKLEPYQIIEYLRMDEFIPCLMSFDVNEMNSESHNNIVKFLSYHNHMASNISNIPSSQLSTRSSIDSSFHYETLAAPLSIPLTSSISNPFTYNEPNVDLSKRDRIKERRTSTGKDNTDRSQSSNGVFSFHLPLSENLKFVEHSPARSPRSSRSSKSARSALSARSAKSRISSALPTPRSARSHPSSAITTLIETLHLWLEIQHELYLCERVVNMQEKVRIIDHWISNQKLEKLDSSS